MGITAAEIDGLLARFGNQIVNEQVNWATPFVGNGHIQKIKHTHELGIVRMRDSDGLQSTGQIEDGGTLPAGKNVSFEKGSYQPKIFFTRLSIPRAAAHLAAGGRDGVRLVKEEVEVAGRQLGQVLGQAVFESPIMTMYGPAASATIATAAASIGFGAGATIEIKVPSLAGLYISQFLGITDSVGGRHENIEVVGMSSQINTKVDGTALTDTNGKQLAAGFYSIQLKNNGLAIGAVNIGGVTDPVAAGVPGVDAPGTSALFIQKLTAAPTVAASMEPMTSLADCYANATGLYGITNGNWTGNTQTLLNGLSIKAMRDMSTNIKRRAGGSWHMLVMNSSALQRYFETGVTGPNDTFTNWLPGQTMKDADGGSTMPTFQGLPIVIDENVNDRDIYYFNKDDVKLAEFKDFATDSDTSSGSHGMVDRQSLIYDTQIWGMYNMRCTRRNSGGRLTNIFHEAVSA
tara:strand:- start:3646 stop:5025 length:1380 start_codon:yes stop_codon:yes gene_type:complete